MQTGKLFVRDRNARAIFCIGFFAAQHPVKDVLPCTENRLIVHRIGDNGSLTVKVAVFHKEILRAAVTFNNVFIDVPAFDILEKGEIITHRDKEREELLAIRNGKYLREDGSYAPEFFEFVDALEKRFQDDVRKTPLPGELLGN